MKERIHRIIRKLGFDVCRYDLRQTGKDPLRDMAKFLDTDRPTIFDVGANIGQSIHRFRAQFPRCKIHAFEPSPTTFETLCQQVSRFPEIHLWNCALGANPGQLQLLENTNPDMSSFLQPGEFAWGKVTRQTPVEIRTVDQMFIEQKLDRIDVLKSDTQGFELEVFKGAEQTLRAGHIRLIYFEVTFSAMYQGSPSFGEIYDFLLSHGFLLVSFYELFYQKQLASWTDALFIHKSFRSEAP